jgi:hypothetical protein
MAKIAQFEKDRCVSRLRGEFGLESGKLLLEGFRGCRVSRSDQEECAEIKKTHHVSISNARVWIGGKKFTELFGFFHALNFFASRAANASRIHAMDRAMPKSFPAEQKRFLWLRPCNIRD